MQTKKSRENSMTFCYEPVLNLWSTEYSKFLTEIDLLSQNTENVMIVGGLNAKVPGNEQVSTEFTQDLAEVESYYSTSARRNYSTSTIHFSHPRRNEKARTRENRSENTVHTAKKCLKSSKKGHVLTRLKLAKERKMARHWNIISMIRTSKWDHCLLTAKIQLQKKLISTTTLKPQGNQKRSPIEMLRKTKNSINSSKRNWIYSTRGTTST